MRTKPLSLPSPQQQRILDRLIVVPARKDEVERCNRLLARHHYLGSLQPVGERLYYVAKSPSGAWMGVMVFSSAAHHLKARDQWLGWTSEQRCKRRALVVNNARFLILPHKSFANLGTRMMRLALDRLSDDWVKYYEHPVLVVETFVDPQVHDGVVYRAGGWTELGATQGWGRCAREYYVKHNRPKRLFIRELERNARRRLCAQQLGGDLAMVEAKVEPRCTMSIGQVRSLSQKFKNVKDYRGRIGTYPIWGLLSLIALASLCGCAKGQKEVARFARRLTHYQRRALGFRCKRGQKCPTPSQPTLSRLLAGVDGEGVEKVILEFQTQLRGAPPSNGLIAIDGKEARRSQGHQILTAIEVSSGYYMGSLPVDKKTNEIPIARKLLGRLDVQGQLVGLDALHTQTDTAQAIVMEHGADYLLTVKGNQKKLRNRLKNLLPATPAGFSPSTQCANDRLDTRTQQESAGISSH